MKVRVAGKRCYARPLCWHQDAYEMARTPLLQGGGSTPAVGLLVCVDTRQELTRVVRGFHEITYEHVWFKLGSVDVQRHPPCGVWTRACALGQSLR